MPTLNFTFPDDSLFRKLVESSLDGILVIDAEGFVRLANPAAIALFDDKTNPLLGSHLGAPSMDESVEIILPRGGGLRYVEMRSTEISWEGGSASLASLRDVTELRESEGQFRSLVEAAPDAVLVVTEPTIIAYVNPACCRMIGVDSSEQLLQRPLSTLVDPSSQELFESRRIRLFVTREPTPTVVQQWLRVDGSSFPVGVSSVPITYKGQPAALSFARDLTERRKDEQRSKELEIAAAEAEAASQAKSMFLSTMSHEIRTPMNAIMGYSQLMLRDKSLGSEAVEHLKVINRNGEHLLHIINNVLDMAKLDAGHMTVDQNTFDLRSLVHDLEAIFRLQAATKGIDFDVDVTGESMDHIVADEGKLNQVLINLLGNAVKFTQRGRIALRVSLDKRVDNEVWLCAEVKDSGIGMTVEEQQRLFQPFVQAEGGKVLHHGGTGLGLAISRRLITAMGGSISVTSRPGYGSAFALEIPVGYGLQQHAEPPSERRGKVLRIAPGQDAPRILVVDDLDDNREWLTKLLELLGFSVRAAESGEAGVLAWNKWKPQLILMDIHMPGMNGVEAIRQIRSKPGGDKTLIIALTADAMEQQGATTLSSIVDGLISKPFGEDELLEKIRRHTGVLYQYEESQLENVNTSDSERTSIPADLVAKFRDAILLGDKEALDKLILSIGDRGDPESAARLRHLADRYQYERLMQMLEDA